MRIHLGHHFYGAGNLGDDFMLAGFLRAVRGLAPDWKFTCAVPFAIEPLRRRFPEIEWLGYGEENCRRCIAACDVWLGLGGSPFQSAQSHWFIDHLIGDAAHCAREDKPMFYLGVGVQTDTELQVAEVKRLCAQAAMIWTRDAGSAERLSRLTSRAQVEAAADLAHVFFREAPPPTAERGRLTLVANFDYGTWAGRDAMIAEVDRLQPAERVWLAQESRELPGAERELFAALPVSERERWRLAIADTEGAPLPDVLRRWPSGEWLVSSRYHAAIAGAWAGSRIVVIGTNNKLRAIAEQLGAPLIGPDADAATAGRALAAAEPCQRPVALAEQAHAACAALVRAVEARS